MPSIRPNLAWPGHAPVHRPSLPPDEAREIIDNLVKAGFPADDIMVEGGLVYVGRDAEVSLAASREMLEAGESRNEQYRTNKPADHVGHCRGRVVIPCTKSISTTRRSGGDERKLARTV